MEGGVDYTGDLLSDPDLSRNHSGVFNATDANTSSVFVGMMSPAMNKTVNVMMIILMVITMFSLGCSMEVSKIKNHIVKPKGIAIALVAQYGIMPLTAFFLAKVFRLAELAAVVVLVCGCCPGGNLSNLLTLTLQGDINLSIVMTTVSTLLAFGMMPLLLYLYCQGFDLVTAVPYLQITASLAMILIPCSAGILVHCYRPQYSKTIQRVGLTFLLVGVSVLCILFSVAIGSSILMVLSPPLMAIGALMPLIGYAFGYIISWLFRLNQPERRTIAIETGCQNNQVCITILKLAFTPETMGPMFLFPMVYVAFQLMEALLLIGLLRCHQRFTRRGKEAYQPAVTEDKLNEDQEGTA